MASGASEGGGDDEGGGAVVLAAIDGSLNLGGLGDESFDELEGGVWGGGEAHEGRRALVVGDVGVGAGVDEGEGHVEV